MMCEKVQVHRDGAGWMVQETSRQRVWGDRLESFTFKSATID